MTNAEFIANCAWGRQVREKTHGSLWFDGKHVYSYGSHYPLLVRAGNGWILNDRGYSVTTSKHISYASRYADYRMHIRGGRTSPKELLDYVQDQISETVVSLAALSARAWKQRETLQARQEDLIKTYAFLKDVVTQDQGATIEAVSF